MVEGGTHEHDYHKKERKGRLSLFPPHRLLACTAVPYVSLSVFFLDRKGRTNVERHKKGEKGEKGEAETRHFCDDLVSFAPSRKPLFSFHALLFLSSVLSLTSTVGLSLLLFLFPPKTQTDTTRLIWGGADKIPPSLVTQTKTDTEMTSRNPGTETASECGQRDRHTHRHTEGQGERKEEGKKKRKGRLLPRVKKSPHVFLLLQPASCLKREEKTA